MSNQSPQLKLNDTYIKSSKQIQTIQPVTIYKLNFADAYEEDECDNEEDECDNEDQWNYLNKKTE